jgi:low temperature requirement protein LtrA
MIWAIVNGRGPMDRRMWRYFWQRPRTHREVITERRVSFLELFYDLIYVVLIARVAQGLHGTITLDAVATFGVLFGLLWVGWFNGTLLHDAHGRPTSATA